MIVEPDFLTHWKTQMLVTELGDASAPLYVIALWAHCHQRKAWRFQSLTAGALKAICRFPGDGDALRSALLACGFLDPEEDGFTEVHGWAETNAKLIANWKNGPKGGRPSQKPTANPTVTHSEPTANPQLTDRTDRTERIEKTTSKPPSALRWSAEGGWEGILDPDKSEWILSFPACDIDRQLAAMSSWLKANPVQAKKSNWRRFVVNWLKKEQDKGGDVRGAKLNGTHRNTHTESARNVGTANEGRSSQYAGVGRA